MGGKCVVTDKRGKIVSKYDVYIKDSLPYSISQDCHILSDNNRVTTYEIEKKKKFELKKGKYTYYYDFS